MKSLNRGESAYRLRFVPSVFLISWSALNFAQFNTFSTIDDLDTKRPISNRATVWQNVYALPFFMKSSESVGLDPNLEDNNVMVSLV